MRRSILVLALAALIGGCGGDDDDGSADGDGAVSREEYIAQGDEICDEVNTAGAELNAEAQAALAENDFAAAADAIEEAADTARPQLEEFEALPRPEGDEATLDEFFALIDREVNMFDEMAATLREGDLDAFVAARQSAQPIDDEADAIAQDYGFEVCGQDIPAADTG